jgi:hypothetical protein
MDGNEIHITRRNEVINKSILLGDYTNPPYQKLDFEICTAAEHEILDDFEPFSIEDEPYQFEFDLSRRMGA